VGITNVTGFRPVAYVQATVAECDWRKSSNPLRAPMRLLVAGQFANPLGDVDRKPNQISFLVFEMESYTPLALLSVVMNIHPFDLNLLRS
jgi:hypothetical protein